MQVRSGRNHNSNYHNLLKTWKPIRINCNLKSKSLRISKATWRPKFINTKLRRIKEIVLDQLSQKLSQILIAILKIYSLMTHVRIRSWPLKLSNIRSSSSPITRLTGSSSHQAKSMNIIRTQKKKKDLMNFQLR